MLTEIFDTKKVAKGNFFCQLLLPFLLSGDLDQS